MKKAELRKKYKTLRKQLTKDEIEEKSLAIANQLLKLPIWEFSYYHIFLPIETLKEINTQYILNILSGKDKNTVIPKTNFETNTLNHFLLTDATKLKISEYGIPEPENGIPIPTHLIDVVFVPLLAYDKLGNRVGYGKGFYDSFLAQCNPNVLKIGLSLFEPEENTIEDTHSNDIKINYCINPTKINVF